MRWATAVKEWNSVQFFKDDLYGIPKKGGEYYDEVKAIMDASKFKKDVNTMMGKPAEVTEEVDDMRDFIKKYVEEGGKIDKKDIWYVPYQLWFDFFLLDHLKKNKDMAALVTKYESFPKPFYSFNLDISKTKKTGFRDKQIELPDKEDYDRYVVQIARAIKDKKDLIFSPFMIPHHANLLIYRHKTNAFEHFEPHGVVFGSSFQDRYVSKETKEAYEAAKQKEKTMYDEYMVKYNEFEKIKDDPNVSDRDKTKGRLLNQSLFDSLTEQRKVLSEALAKYNKEYADARKKFIESKIQTIIDKIWGAGKKSSVYKDYFKTKPSIIGTDVLHEGIEGFQEIEGKQKKKALSEEEYENQVSGFCVMWSIFVCELVARYPDKSTKEIIKMANERLSKMSENSFFTLMVGYIKEKENLIKEMLTDVLGFTEFSFKRMREAQVADKLNDTRTFQEAYKKYRYLISDEIEKLNIY
jgi:hypothetical protein